MKLYEITNVVSKGNKTSLTGGDLPNAYRDNASAVSKKPRKKKKDVYGTGVGLGINSQGTNDTSGGDGSTTSGDGGTATGGTSGSTGGGGTSGGSGGGSSGGGSGGGGGS